jgi:hypothetical protein
MLSAYCNAALVGISTSSFDPDAQQALVYIDPSNGLFLKSIPLQLDSVVPNSMIASSPAHVAFCTISAPTANITSYCVVELNTSDATVSNQWCSAALVLDNVAFDGARLLVTGYDLSIRQHFIFEANSTGLIRLFAVPSTIKIQVALSAFMVAENRWYCLNSDEATGANHLIYIDMSTRTMHDANIYIDTVILMAIDSRARRLLVWTASNSTGSASLLDTSLTPPHTLLSFPNLSADGGQTLMTSDGVLRSRLLDINTDQPYWFNYNQLAPPSAPTPVPLYPWLLAFVEL